MRAVIVGLVTLVLLAACSSSDGSDVATSDSVSGQDDATEGGSGAGAPAATATDAADSDVPNNTIGDGLFPTVIDANATPSDGIGWRLDVTLLSEYDAPDRYADAWRVLDADDNELGIRVLAHDHAGEQPFTRSTSIDVPANISSVFIEGRDQVNGWSGERFELILDR